MMHRILEFLLMPSTKRGGAENKPLRTTLIPSHLATVETFSNVSKTNQKLSLTLAEHELPNRKFLEAAVLRSTLHKYWDVACNDSTRKRKRDNSIGSAQRVICVDNISLCSVDPISGGRVSVSASADLTLADVNGGLTVGVAESLQYDGALLVSVPSGHKSSTHDDNETVRLLVRVGEAEVAQPGQSVLLISEAGSISCMGIRTPRDALGKFDISSDLGEDGFTTVVYRSPDDDFNTA